MTPRPAHGDGPTGPSTPTGRTELRDRIAQALTAKFIARHGGADEIIRSAHRDHADAILPVVEDAIARYRMQVDDPDSLLTQLDKARDAIADERRGRLAAEAAVRRVRLVCMPPTAPDLRTEVLAALDAEQEAPGAERAAPIDWEAIVRQRERELKQVGEARHQAEAAVRRVKHVLAWKTLLAGPQAEKAVRVADVEAALDAEQPKETP